MHQAHIPPPTTGWMPASSVAPPSSRVATLLVAIGCIVALQVWLIFNKSINWDEFFHFSQIYELKAGRLSRDLQVLHARLFAWAPLVSDDIITQIQTARFVMLGGELVATAAIIALAHRFVSRETAWLAGFAYLSAGYVFNHGFSFRSDPLLAGLLMTALWALGTRKLNFATLGLVAMLIGAAGLMNMKAVFYAPCFAGIAWMRIADAPNRTTILLRLCAVPAIAALAFFALFQLNRSDLPLAPSMLGSLLTGHNGFFSSGLFAKGEYTLLQMMIAPVITLATLMAPLGWNKAGLSKPERIALASLLVPLLSLVFYRNTFPYYFTFLMPPVIVAASPVFDMMKQRLKLLPLMGILSLTPAAILITEPRDVIERQRTLIAQLHRIYPEPVGYLSYAGIVPDYPRIINFLTSGLGLKGYHNAGKPTIARQIEAGNVAFVVADSPPIRAGLHGLAKPEAFQPEDNRALKDNFLPLSGPLWLSGKWLCRRGESELSIVRPGPYTLDGANAVIDGRIIRHGQTIRLARGSHQVTWQGKVCGKLWALPYLPQPIPILETGPIKTRF